jgi:hypothetical protein
MSLDPDDPVVESAVLGKEAEDFLTSRIGQYLITRVDSEIEEARLALETTSPWRRRRIQDLQARIWRAQSFKGWMADIITDGRNALQLIEESNAP